MQSCGVAISRPAMIFFATCVLLRRHSVAVPYLTVPFLASFFFFSYKPSPLRPTRKNFVSHRGGLWSTHWSPLPAPGDGHEIMSKLGGTKCSSQLSCGSTDKRTRSVMITSCLHTANPVWYTPHRRQGFIATQHDRCVAGTNPALVHYCTPFGLIPYDVYTPFTFTFPPPALVTAPCLGPLLSPPSSEETCAWWRSTGRWCVWSWRALVGAALLAP